MQIKLEDAAANVIPAFAGFSFFLGNHELVLIVLKSVVKFIDVKTFLRFYFFN